MFAFIVPISPGRLIPSTGAGFLADLTVACSIFLRDLEPRGSTVRDHGRVGVSNSKYPFLGSLRSVGADDFLYEVSIGLIIHRGDHLHGLADLWTSCGPRMGTGDPSTGYWLAHFPMLFLFFISALARRTGRRWTARGGKRTGGGYQMEYFLDAGPACSDRRAVGRGADVRPRQLAVPRGWLSPIPGPAGRGALGWPARLCFLLLHLRDVEGDHAALRYGDQLHRLGW